PPVQDHERVTIPPFDDEQLGVADRYQPSPPIEFARHALPFLATESYSTTARTCPAFTGSPACTRTSTTTPDRPAATHGSIFIASRTATGSPALTLVPLSTATLSTVPAIGATDSPGPRPPCTAAEAEAAMAGFH